jgi:hypothetical protein
VAATNEAAQERILCSISIGAFFQERDDGTEDQHRGRVGRHVPNVEHNYISSRFDQFYLTLSVIVRVDAVGRYRADLTPAGLPTSIGTNLTRTSPRVYGGREALALST